MKKFLLCGILFLSLIVSGEWWDDAAFPWMDAKELTHGVLYQHISQTSPRLMKVWVMRIDLNENFGFVTSKKAENHGETIPTHPKLKIHTLRQKTTDFMLDARMKGIEMIAAINAAPWSPWDRTPSPYSSNLGLLISDGEVVSPVRPHRATFVVYKNGKVAIKVFDAEDKLDNIAQAVTGFSMALIKNEPVKSGNALAPRTGLGLSKDKRFLYWVVIDGRQMMYSTGASVNEVGKILKYLGAYDGINMDGGGSSSFVIWDQVNKTAKMLNQQPLGRIRAVGASLGIYRKQQ